MKAFKAFAVLALAAFVMSSCNNIEKILPKKDGVWNVTSATQRDYEDGTLVSTTTETSNLGTYTFNSDGTGVIADDSTSENITWSANSDNDQVTIAADGGGLALVYDVLESEKKKQKWQTSLEIEILGVVSRTEFEMEMERAD